MSDIKKIKDEYLVKINNNHNLDNLNQIKSELFGKNGIIALEFKKISSISANEKKQFASNLNLIKDELQNALNKGFETLEAKEINSKLQNEKLDITLPERNFNQGKVNPVSQVIDEISSTLTVAKAETPNIVLNFLAAFPTALSPS